MSAEFENRLKRLSPTLRRITHKLNGHFSFFDDDDLYQEALERLWVWSKNGEFSDTSDSYLLQGCYYHLKNYLRKTLDKNKLVSLSSIIDEEGSTLEKFLAYEDKAPADSAAEVLLAGELASARLTGREKSVLKYSLDGLTIREIGSRLGVSHVMIVKLKKRIMIKCKPVKNICREDRYQN